MRERCARLLTRMLWVVPTLLLVSTAPLAGAPPSAANPAPSCGDGLFTAGETCADCPADCTPKACKVDGKKHQRYSIAVAWPTGPGPTDVTALVSYRTGTLSMPGNTDDKSVQGRVTERVKTDLLAVRDSDYALAVTLAVANGLPSGPLLEIDFDACDGAQAPTVADVRCEVLGCVGPGGQLAGCSCQISAL